METALPVLAIRLPCGCHLFMVMELRLRLTLCWAHQTGALHCCCYLMLLAKMAGRLATFLRNAWAKEPVLVVSFTIAGLAIVLPSLSPYTKYSAMINQVTPYNYPVPLRDDGNMPDVPSHPQDPQGPSLEWLKKL